MAPSILFDHCDDVSQSSYHDATAKVSLNNGVPAFMDASLAWSGANMQDESKYTKYLTAIEVKEVEHALNNFKALRLKPEEVNRTNFPLPVLESQLTQLAREIHKGKGFFILKGLEATRYSPVDNVSIFLGISSYIGEKRGKQDHHGNMLIHIRNAVEMKRSQQDRPAMDSKLSLAFHTDMFTDMLGLQTLGRAARGGAHILSPTYAIYNELQSTRPDLLAALMNPVWDFDTRSLHFDHKKRPLIAYHGGHVIFNFGRFTGSGATVLRDSLSAQQVEALDVMHALAAKHQLKLFLQPGDLCFMNNLAMLHAREYFEDGESLDQVRHLVRLFIKNERLAWDLPEHVRKGNEKVFGATNVEERWEIEAPKRLGYDVREKFSP